MKILSHDGLARLHPSPFETPGRPATLLERFEWSPGRRERAPEDLLRCHTPAHVDRTASIERETCSTATPGRLEAGRPSW